MILKKITIHNFRGYKGENIFDLSIKDGSYAQLILCAGPNGFGKTSLLEAIEWALTGKIERVLSDLKARTNQRERNTNIIKKGLLRNINVDVNKVVSVRIEIEWKSQVFEIFRVFSGTDEFGGIDGISDMRIIGGSDELNHKLIDSWDELIEGFSTKRVCSYERNLELYKKSRTDMYNIFSEFFNEPKKIDLIIYNLDNAKKELQSKIDLLNNSKETKDEERRRLIFDNSKNIISDQELDDINAYPKQKLYNTEIHPSKYFDMINEGKEPIELIKNQRQVVKYLEMIYLKLQLENYIEWFKEVKRYKQFSRDIKEVYSTNKSEINRIKSIDLVGLNEDLKYINQLIKQLSNKLTTSELEEILKTFGTDYVWERLNTYSFLIPNDLIKEIKDGFSQSLKLNNESIQLSEQLTQFNTNQKWIEALRALVDNIEGYNEVRKKGVKSCPLCGSSEKFSSCDLTYEAKQLLGKSDYERKELRKKINGLNERIMLNNKSCIDKLLTLSNCIKSDIQMLINDINKYKTLSDQCSHYGFTFKQLNDQYLSQLDKKLNENLLSLRGKTKDIRELEKMLSYPNNRITYLNSKISTDQFVSVEEFNEWSEDDKFEGINIIYSNLNNSIKVHNNIDSIVDTSLDYDLFDIRLRSRLLDILINYGKNIACSRKVNKLKTEIDEYGKSVLIFEDKKQRLDQLSGDIKSEKVKFEKQLSSLLVQPLEAIYSKITRNTNVDKLTYCRVGKTNNLGELKAVNRDGAEAFVSNIMSSGQISTVAIALFFASAMVNEKNDMKFYFMDDPIQSMDDLNILSFVDLLRSEFMKQRDEKKAINQLFLTVCDEDLENLISHKMQSFNINMCKFNFTGYSNYEKSIVQ